MAVKIAVDSVVDLAAAVAAAACRVAYVSVDYSQGGVYSSDIAVGIDIAVNSVRAVAVGKQPAAFVAFVSEILQTHYSAC